MLVIGELQLSRVLVIGEGPRQADVLAAGLGTEIATSGGQLTLALRAIFSFRPDLILLNSCGPDSPRELFGFVSEATEIPIVVLGSSDSKDDLLWYLDRGAVGYYSKETSDGVLSARIGAILRRLEESRARGVLRIGSLEVDSESHVVRKDSKPVQLTPIEFRMVQVLAENAGKPCDHAMLLERVWGEEFRSCLHYLRLYVGYLRQKIEDDPKCPRILLTDWGIGYRLVADESLPVVPTRGSARLVPA